MGGSLALSVHGPAGVVDLVVPSGAAVSDVAREYAEQSGLGDLPVLHTSRGELLHRELALAEAGVRAGSMLVATVGAGEPGPVPERPAPGHASYDPGPLASLWFGVAAAVAGLAGWCAAGTDSPPVRATVIVLLAVAAVLGAVPVGRLAAQRALVAPVFAGAAGFALVWDPQPERLPSVVGVTALVAAVAAAVARSVERRRDEALRVWITAGLTVFIVTGLATLVGLPPRVSWALLLVGALLAARFVPGFVVAVPDQYLIDLDRLAVTAWSAREPTTGKRSRSVVSRPAIAEVAARGARLVTAYGVAILAVVATAAPLLLASTPLTIDRIGARCLVGFCAVGLLLAARSHRNPTARALLRTAGLVSAVALLGAVVHGLGGRAGVLLAGTALAVAVAVLVAAVATGRGWRSAWWSRRAEVAEALCGSAAIASVLVASGVFRRLWESIHLQV